MLRVEVMDGEGEGHGRSWTKRKWAEVLEVGVMGGC